MSASSNLTMHRSTSMPAKPRYLEPKKLKRSKEKEVVYEEDYYPESPPFERNRKFEPDSEHNVKQGREQENDSSVIKKINDFSSTHEWAGSTVELNADMLKSDLDPLHSGNKRKYRVIEKNGRENVIFRKIPEKSWRFFRDFVTTLVRPFLRFFPRKCIKVLPSTTSDNTDSGCGEQSIQTRTDSISSKSEQNLDKLQDHDDKSTHMTNNEHRQERVTFSL